MATNLKTIRIFSGIIICVSLIGCHTQKFGAAKAFNTLNRIQIDSVILYKPIVDPRIEYYGHTYSPGEVIDGNVVTNIGDENEECISDALIDYFNRKVKTLQLSERLKRELTFDFKRLRENDSSSLDLFFEKDLSSKSKIRYSCFVYFRPVKDFSSGLRRYRYIDEEMCLQILLFDNLEKRVVAYLGGCKNFVGYEVSTKRCNKFVSKITRDLFAK